MKLKKIISGGQTGADQGGLRAGRDLGLETGGTAPKGWLTEDGPAPFLAEYGLVESPSPKYPPRTEDNVRDSDGTLIFGNEMSRGCTLTKNLCERMGKPFLCVSWRSGDEVPDWPDSRIFLEWLEDNEIDVLNVAGNRESKQSGIGDAAYSFLMECLG